MVSGPSRPASLRFRGPCNLRYRLTLAVLSGRTVRFDEIRVDDDEAPGLSPAEISFIRLLDKITNGSAIEINETGTTLRFRPGLLIGQSSSRMQHECHPSRPIGYYLELLLMLAPFCKRPLDITLRGPTHGTLDACVDSLAAVSVPLLRRLTLGTPLSPEIVVVRRAAASDADTYAGGRGGAVIFRCDVLRLKVAPIELVDAGLVRRVRGIAFANRVSPSHIGQMVDGVRSVLNRFTPDVYVHTDHTNSMDGGAGFGVQLTAETTEGCLLGADWAAVDTSQSPQLVSERAISMLLDQVAQGGCIDAHNACLGLLMCALADSDVSRIRLGRLTDFTVCFMRDLQAFFGVVFKVQVEDLTDLSDEDTADRNSNGMGKKIDGSTTGDQETFSELSLNGIVLSCIGIGLTNIARQRF